MCLLHQSSVSRISVPCSSHVSAMQWRVSLSHMHLGLIHLPQVQGQTSCVTRCHPILSYMVLFIPLTSAQSPFCLQTFPRHPPGCATSKVLQKPFLDIFFIVFLRSQATALTGNRNLFSLEHSQEAVVFPPPTPHIPQSPGAERVSFMAPIAADRQFFSS